MIGKGSGALGAALNGRTPYGGTNGTGEKVVSYWVATGTNGSPVTDFDLLAYLVCAHHGKVRQAWHASPSDQEANDGRLRIRGVRDGEELPQLTLTAIDGSHIDLPASTLHLALAGAGLNPLTGKGWTERVLGLLERHGPFTLAWLEALLRAADQRASRELIADPLLDGKESP